MKWIAGDRVVEKVDARDLPKGILLEMKKNRIDEYKR